MTALDANSVNGPGPVGSWEALGRRVFSRSEARRAARGRIQPKVFLERPGVRKLSVDRLTRAEAAAELAEVVEDAKTAAANRQLPPNIFCGWAVVNVEAVIRASCSVTDSPLPNNRYHANIVLPDSAMENDEAQRGYATTLAGKAKWKPCPS